MIFKVGERSTGKTQAPLEWMREAPEGEHRVMVCHSRQSSMAMLRAAREAGLDLESWQFVCADEVVQSRGGGWEGVPYGRGGAIVLGIDNADLILPSLFQQRIGYITGTGELA